MSLSIHAARKLLASWPWLRCLRQGVRFRGQAQDAKGRRTMKQLSRLPTEARPTASRLAPPNPPKCSPLPRQGPEFRQ